MNRMPGLPRVLIVDYDPKILRSLQELLAENGYHVDTVRDGNAAIAAFHELNPSIVLLEAMIPKKHGFEVCQEIKKSPAGRSTPVVIMTAVYKGRKYRTQAMHVHGCDEYVEKPCTPEALLEIVKRFVPPGRVAEALAVGSERHAHAATAERFGEVIQFPSNRSTQPAPDIEDETEREIMSKLNEILPDTPVFDERGLGMPAPAAPDETSLEVEFAPVEAPYEAPIRPARSVKPDVNPEIPAKAKRIPPAPQPAEGERRIRTRRPPVPKPETVGSRRRFISILYVVGFIVAVVATIVAYLMGRV